MKRFAFVALGLISASAQAFEFKGIEVGGPATFQSGQIEAALKWDPGKDYPIHIRPVKCEKVKSGNTFCSGPTTVAGVYGRTEVRTTPAGVVTRLVLIISSRDFDTVEAGVVTKYGQPTKTSNDAVQNRMGATFQNVEHYWEGEGGRYIRLSKYAGSLEDSTLYFGTAEDTAAFAPKPNIEDL